MEVRIARFEKIALVTMFGIAILLWSYLIYLF